MAFYVMKKNGARFGLQTDNVFAFRVMDDNFGSLRCFSRQQRELKPIGHLPMINLS
jgi:hypothetical protein